MSLTIKLNGQEFTNFLEASVLRTMDAVSGSFSFASTVDASNNFPIKEDDAVDIFVDGTQVIKGFVEGFDSNSAPDAHDVRVFGRDILGDLIDSTVNTETSEFRASSLLDIARAVLDGINLFDVEVIDRTGDVGPFEQIDLTSAETTQSAFDFLESYARKQQILLNTDGLGNLVFTRASGEIFPVILRDGNGGNIISARKHIDNSLRFNSYTALSQLNPITVGSGVSPANLSNQKGLAIDSAIRTSRVFAFDAEESSDSLTAKDRATWESNLRRARSLSYSATVQGHSVSINNIDILWEPNKLVLVLDNFNRLGGMLLIRSVRYEESVDTGTTTVIDMTYRDAYTLQAEQSRRDALNEDDF